jgi:putative phosphoribosyl transferase
MQAVEQSVRIQFTQKDALDGELRLPENAFGIVIFAHGSGSSRHSPRNQFVARALNKAGLATLLLDLLTPEEDFIDLQTRTYRFDITLLAHRLMNAVDWVVKQPETRSLNIGLFGASTGAGAALVAAANRPSFVSAVVSRGGRPDLAEAAIAQVRAATLLIVGEKDEPVIEMNQQAYDGLTVEKRMEIVSNATHLFEEPGALDQVAQLAGEWFTKYLDGDQ